MELLIIKLYFAILLGMVSELPGPEAGWVCYSMFFSISFDRRWSTSTPVTCFGVVDLRVFRPGALVLELLAVVRYFGDNGAAMGRPSTLRRLFWATPFVVSVTIAKVENLFCARPTQVSTRRPESLWRWRGAPVEYWEVCWSDCFCFLDRYVADLMTLDSPGGYSPLFFDSS